MADRKRIWFSFLPLDYLGVEAYLNHYAAQGWALSEISDCHTLTVTLERSQRTDLRYLVSCSSLTQDQTALREKVAQMQALGWQPIATVNHFDIYESMPCRHAVVSREKPSLELFFWSIGALVLFSALSLFLLLLAYFRDVAILNAWYLSNTGIFLHTLGPVCAVVCICYFLWIGYRLAFREKACAPQKSLTILQGILPVLAMGWIFCLTAAVVADLVHSPAYCLLLLLVMAAAIAFCYMRFRAERRGKLFSGVSLTLALVIALSLVLNQVFPGENRAQLGECSWRTSLSAVVRGEEIGFYKTPVEAVSYERVRSLFVTKTEYWEQRADVSLSSEVYQCSGALFCHIVEANLLRSRNWQPVSSTYDDCWSENRNGKYALLLRTGNTLILLSSDQELLPHLSAFTLRLE